MNVGNGPDLNALRAQDPFGAAYVEKFVKEQERKRAFLEQMMRSVPPGVWGQIGQSISEAVMKAPGDKLDQVFRDMTLAVDNFLKTGGSGAAGRMGVDALLNIESSPVLTALTQVEKFLGSAAPKDEP